MSVGSPKKDGTSILLPSDLLIAVQNKSAHAVGSSQHKWTLQNSDENESITTINDMQYPIWIYVIEYLHIHNFNKAKKN